MKIPRIANAVGYLDDELVVEAATYGKKKKSPWLKWGAAAACLAMLILAGILLSSLVRGRMASDGKDKRYREYTLAQNEIAVIWPWEYLTVYEKYTDLEMDGVPYLSRGSRVSEDLVGERIGSFPVTGYDHLAGWGGTDAALQYTEEFEVFALKDIAPGQFVAVKMEGSYYVFEHDEYAPPATLGELMDEVDFPKVVELNCFDYEDQGRSYFALTDDDPIWEILSACGSAPFVEDQRWMTAGRRYLSFTFTSEALGVYNCALYVTEDGYLWTNAFGWQYLFEIGEEAAGEILRYAKENSVETVYEPYQKYIAGIITEITDAYILVDDSILCKDPDEGITYKVLLDDLRISRYVEREIVRVGDAVQISYRGEIDETDGNAVTGAVSLNKVFIYDGDVMIYE